jgi:DNA invertase Pin-like site-specific DNA recombinase
MPMIGYARVSRLDQNLELQERALREVGCRKIFVEKGSGADKDRPELRKCLQFLRKDDCLVFWKLDRLARSIMHLGEIAQDCRDRGIDLKCLTQPIDTTNSTGKLMFNVLASFAQFERDLIIERTNAGLAAARAAGRIGGRPKGYRKIDGKWMQTSGIVSQEGTAA